MHLEIDTLRKLLELLDEKDIAEFEHQDEKVRFKVVRTTRAAPQVMMQSLPPQMFAQAHAPQTAAHASPAQPAQADAAEAADTVDVTSPFVGTFYRAPSPDTPSFVEIGSVVKPGQTLCIIEAMKLMNEIEAECAGTVVECFAQNGKAVEFGQKLFRIKKA
jgi:acetyl-CoA carboxylase biotin carboxyl carrier protein